MKPEYFRQFIVKIWKKCGKKIFKSMLDLTNFPLPMPCIALLIYLGGIHNIVSVFDLSLLTYFMYSFTCYQSQLKTWCTFSLFILVGAQGTVPWLQKDVLGGCRRCVWSQESRSQEVAECPQSYYWTHPFQHHSKCSSCSHGCNTYTAATACYRSECIQVIASYC